MIFVKRTNEPGIFQLKKEIIEEEIRLAEKHYKNPNKVPKPNKLFSLYKTYKKHYRDQLYGMFQHRCAYCESIVTVSHRGDVEHFRPKGESVAEDGKVIEPGYYWLAAAWENLYLSCINCNQKTSFKIIDSKDPTKIKDKTCGKMSQFALKDEKFRLKNRSQKIHFEEPYRLLIDPCCDRPETMLEFTTDGIVKARTQNGIQNKMAEYSIDVYALQRERLVEIRKRRYLEVMDKIATIKNFKDLVVDGIKQRSNTNQHQVNMEEMKKSFSQLFSLLNAENAYSDYIGAVRQFAEPFLNEYIGFLSTILDPASNQNQPWYQDALDYFQPQLAALKLHFEKL